MQYGLRTIIAITALALCSGTHAAAPTTAVQPLPPEILYPVPPLMLVPQVIVNGVEIGVGNKDAVLGANPGATCVALSNPRNEQTCTARVLHAGAEAKVVYVLLDGRVVGATVTFRRDDFDRVLGNLTAQYGTPEQLERSSSLLKEAPTRAYWFVAGVKILATKDPDLGESTLVYQATI